MTRSDFQAPGSLILYTHVDKLPIDSQTAINRASRGRQNSTIYSGARYMIDLI